MLQRPLSQCDSGTGEGLLACNQFISLSIVLTVSRGAGLDALSRTTDSRPSGAVLRVAAFCDPRDGTGRFLFVRCWDWVSARMRECGGTNYEQE